MGCNRFSKIADKSSSSLDEETRELVEKYEKITISKCRSRSNSEPIIHRPIIKRRRRLLSE